MEEFVNSLNIFRFESTNGLWNELMLNDPWSVGYVATLIETREFATKEDWEDYYYRSGMQRETELAKLSPGLFAKLNNEQLVRTNRSEISQMDQGVKNLNYNFGRTKQQLKVKASILYEEARKRGISIMPEECFEAVRFRTICQTWNGVVVRERKAVALLKQVFPDFIYQKTSGELDYDYAVDYQVWRGTSLICGIQIKPASYSRSNAPYVQAAKNANKRKNQNFVERYGVPVFNLFFEKDQIINSIILEDIMKLNK